MPWRAPCSVAGPLFPRAVKPLLNSPSRISCSEAGRSTSTQWKKSTRARSAGTSRSGLLTSSPRLGTSKSWQISASDCVPAGTSLHAKCGFRLSEKVGVPPVSSLPAAYLDGMRSPLTQLSLQSFIDVSRVSNAPDDFLGVGMRASHHLDQRPGALAQRHRFA